MIHNILCSHITWLSYSAHSSSVACRRLAGDVANNSVGIPTDSTIGAQWIFHEIMKEIKGPKGGDILRVFVGVTWELGIDIVKAH